MFYIKKLTVISLKKIEILSAIAVRLTKYTGKSKVYIHPKHFLTQNPWYTKHANKNDVILDLGSGFGQSAIKAAKLARKVIGVEIDTELIIVASRIVKEKKIKNVFFVNANLERKLNFKNNYFDKVIFLDVLEHLDKREEILKEVRRILKPKGLLFVGVPNNQTSWKKLQRSVGINSFSDPDHKIEFSENEIKHLLNKHHFKIKEFSYGKSDTPYRGLYDIVGAFSIPAYRSISNWRERKAQRQHHEASGFEIVAINSK
jgi:ubiquinone/menaquinone biosynthesis C-methylase UbiE